jgi:AraC family 4-hydroxyphenylacetate 3-monooxygenase operon regulatory protein
MPVSQVAYELGYQDPAYFARFFKKQIGETASDFRQNQKRDSN